MDRAYRAFDGVREITAAAEQLQGARDALDTMTALDILTHGGIVVGDLVLVHGRFVRSSAKPDATANAVGDAQSVDWFS